MSTRAAAELYYDSEATLRLVDNALAELEEMEADFALRDGRGPSLTQQLVAAASDLDELPGLLQRAYGQVQDGLASLRRGRDVLDRTTAEKVLHMGDRVREVDALQDGVDRALALLGRLDETEDAPARAELRGALRDELFKVMGCLRFQDITSQQLSYASSVLSEMESRFAGLAELLDPHSRYHSPPARHQVGGGRRCGIDQLLVEEIFGG